jgi:hypothetical protein
MIETIGPVGHTGGRRTTISACVTFFIGALVGGVVTFGALAALGSIVHGAEERVAYAVAAVVALAAALLEVRGTPIVPQIRRQLPEHWRRLMPMPVAAGLYGILLGLGFTTFVLTFGVWALAGISFALGEPLAGAAIGLAFGIGRAVPVVALAPIAHRPVADRCMERMVGDAALYRMFRLGDGLALLAACFALASAAPASAENTIARNAADPSAAGRDLAVQRADGSAVLLTPDGDRALPGTDPALGDRFAAVTRGGDQIVLLDRRDGGELAVIAAPGVEEIAVSSEFVVWRARDVDRDRIFAASLDDPRNPGKARRVAASGPRSELGRPAVDGDRVVFAIASTRSNRIVLRDLGSGEKRKLVSSKVVGLSNPAISDTTLVYVRHTRNGDSLMRGRVNRGGARELLTRRKGTLWSTSIGGGRAYVTLLRGNPPETVVLSEKL